MNTKIFFFFSLSGFTNSGQTDSTRCFNSTLSQWKSSYTLIPASKVNKYPPPSILAHWWIRKHGASSLCWPPLWPSTGEATPRERSLQVAHWEKNQNNRPKKHPTTNQKPHSTTWTFLTWTVPVSQSIQQPPKGSARAPGEVAERVAQGQEGAAGEQQVQLDRKSVV